MASRVTVPTAGRACEVCGQDCASIPAAFLAELDPADFEGLNMGPEVACTLALCLVCVCDLVPHEAERLGLLEA